MNLLLGFAPFIAFALVDRAVGHLEGLVAGAVVAVALVAREVLAGRSLKILEIGTAILFGGLALYALLAHPAWSIMDVRLRVDAGLLLIVLVSLLIGRPFTGQYARDAVDPALWTSPRFHKTNLVITGVWALAFAVLVAADLILIYRPDIPQHVGVWATIAALVGAFKFTKWYPAQMRRADGG
jgi:hypothetical protein